MLIFQLEFQKKKKTIPVVFKPGFRSEKSAKNERNYIEMR